jgi:hypothetical protein
VAVKGVLTEPTPPTWWKANRHRAYGIGGLLIGYLIGSHLQSTPAPQPHPRPAHSTPAPTAPGPRHTR